MPHDPLADEIFPHDYHFMDGFMYAGDKPGLGVDLDLASKYPYQRAFLPVNRSYDGTMLNWWINRTMLTPRTVKIFYFFRFFNEDLFITDQQMLIPLNCKIE